MIGRNLLAWKKSITLEASKLIQSRDRKCIKDFLFVFNLDLYVMFGIYMHMILFKQYSHV